MIRILREAHQAVEEARARGSTALDAELLDKLRERYDDAATFGMIHNRLRDWHDGNHPGCAPGHWLRGYKEQVFLFTRYFAVDWTNNVSERGAKSRQAPPGRLRLLAFPRHPRPLVPRPQLPRFGCRPRCHRARRRPQRTRRKTLATTTPRRSLKPEHGTPVMNGHGVAI